LIEPWEKTHQEALIAVTQALGNNLSTGRAMEAYLRQYSGINRATTVYISSRPTSMQNINTHFPKVGTRM